MKLIHSKAELLQQSSGLEGVYKQIELAGRTCYKSEDKITEDSAKDFVDRMIKSGHTAMLEHGTVYLTIPCEEDKMPSKYELNPYSKADFFADITYEEGHLYVTTNYRVLVENNWMDDLRFISRPTHYHEKRYTVRFTTDQGILRELTRSRSMSFAVESTRYCNYSKSKFNNEICFIIPGWTSLHEDSVDSIPSVVNTIKLENIGTEAEVKLLCQLSSAEKSYMELLNHGCSPQEARQVLPLATKCDVVMTGFASDWRYFLDLRLFGKTGKPHPDMIELTKKLQKEMMEAGIWEDIMEYQSKFK